jgi:uncharacterized small protein (DUF1192 family)
MNTDQAFEKLNKAGVTDSIQTVRRWLREGKIKAKRSENRKAGFEVDNTDLQRFINERTGADKDERIKSLQKEIKKLQSTLDKKERGKLAQENHKLQLEVGSLRSDLSMLRMKLFKLEIKQSQQPNPINIQLNKYREKLGLSSTCSDDEVKREFKRLLMSLHPDQGGDAKLFQYFKAEYDEFRESIKL